MLTLLKSFKTEINPTEEQIIKINKTIGTCRFIYNFYLSHNKNLYEEKKEFMTGRTFSVWLNNEYLPNNPDMMWIKEVSTKSTKKAMEDGYKAFVNFFKHKSSFPRFKKKGKSDVKMYFVRCRKTDCLCDRHRIKVPTLGWVRLKEKGYILRHLKMVLLLEVGLFHVKLDDITYLFWLIYKNIILEVITTLV